MRRSRCLAAWAILAAVAWSLAGTAALAAGSYTARKGDNLWSIARKCSVSTYALKYANRHLGPKPLDVGQRVIIPPQKSGIPGHKAQVTEAAALRAQPAVGGSLVARLYAGERLWVEAVSRDWCKVKTAAGNTGWVAGDYVVPYLYEAPKRAAVAPKTVSVRRATYSRHTQRTRYASSRRTATPQPQCSELAQSDEGVVRTAYAYRGSRYRSGGTGANGFDCSGFTRYVYSKHGVRLPHNSKAQYGVGQRVSKGDLKSGDLVFFHTTRAGISHVGIYAGNGKFIHASSHGRGVRVDSLNSGYYSARFRGASRVR